MKNVRIPERFLGLKAEALRKLPTLATGQAASLKIEDGPWRVWLSRCDVADGEPYKNKVEIEHYDGERWEEVHHYQAYAGRTPR